MFSNIITPLGSSIILAKIILFCNPIFQQFFDTHNKGEKKRMREIEVKRNDFLMEVQ